MHAALHPSSGLSPEARGREQQRGRPPCAAPGARLTGRRGAGGSYPSDDINKFLWMVRIGGGVFPEIKEKDFLGEGGYRVDDKAGKARAPGAAAITGLRLGSGPAAVGRTPWAMAATAWTTRPARRARQGRRCHRGRVGAAPASARMCRKACMRSTAGEARGCIVGQTIAHEDGARHPGSRAAQRSRLPAPRRAAHGASEAPRAGPGAVSG